MNKQLFILLLLSIAAYGQQQPKRIAIVNTEDDGEPPIKNSELTHLTDKLREIANKTLPSGNYAVMTQQSIFAFLGSQESMVKECKEAEGCLAKLGRKINADYIGQARIGRFGKDLAIKVELYESGSGVLINSFAGESKDIYGLLSVLDKEAPVLFKKLPGALSFDGGISGVQSTDGNYKFEGGKSYLASINTEPEGAVVSFNGVPSASCKETPCKAELREGSVRIIANLEQYEIADTTVFIKQNNQNIAIKLKPNFGVLEIKSAYLDGIGKNAWWNLSINDTPYSLGEVRLSPNKYAVKLSHECYEDIGFNAGINKGKREVFDMASHLNLKKGGLVLSAERNGEPVSEPVFVNGKQVGETPFSGSVPLCSEIRIGENKEAVYLKLKHNEKIEYTYSFYTNKSRMDEIRALAYVENGRKPAIAQKSNSSYTIQSTFNAPIMPAYGIYYQRIWDMHHIGFFYGYGLLYSTLGVGGGEERPTSYGSSLYKERVTEFEFMQGFIHRWVIIPDNFIKMSFGLFGGLGLRNIEYCEGESTECYNQDDDYYWRHELGVELVLGYLSLYIAERNFHRIGVGMGVVFWWNREKQGFEW